MSESDRKEQPIIPISVFIICKDEADCIADCLRPFKNFAEMVVVDSGSTDGTLDIISRLTEEGYPIRLFERVWPGYGAQKQFALEQCGQDWCLNVDADERVDSELAASIAAIANGDCDGRVAGWTVRRRDWINGYGYAHRLVVHQDIVRFTRKGHASYTLDRTVHESLVVEGMVGQIRRGWLLHERRMSLSKETRRLSVYADLKVQDRVANGIRPRLYKLLFSPVGTFLKMYLLKRYFLCGIPGFIYARVIAQYTFATEEGHHLAIRKNKAS